MIHSLVRNFVEFEVLNGNSGVYFRLYHIILYVDVVCYVYSMHCSVGCSVTYL